MVVNGYTRLESVAPPITFLSLYSVQQLTCQFATGLWGLYMFGYKLLKK